MKSGNQKGKCPRCAKGTLVTDANTGENFCAKCGFVITDKVEESGPEWRSFSKEEHEGRSRAGVPLYAIYSHKASAKHFFKSLWHPYENLHIHEKKKAIALIVLVAIFFGVAHIISGEAWSSGKFAQAAASGIIIGWVYFRYGLAPALLIHWATNYFIFSYVYLISDINFVTISEAFSHSMLQTFEIMFVIAGIISVAMMAIHRRNSQKQERLEI